MNSKEKKEGISIVHGYARRIERHINKLENQNSNNSKKILDFYHYLLNKRYAEATLEKYLIRLIHFSTWFEIDFDDATKEDLMKLINEKVNKRNDLKENSKTEYKKTIRNFYKWLKGCKDDEYPEEVEENHKQPEELLDDEDIEKLIKVASNPRDKAFIIMLAESGCRIGELLTLQIENIIFDDRGAYFLVDGKTGIRRVRVVNATPYLHVWLNHHPDKDNPKFKSKISHMTVYNIIKKSSAISNT